MKDVFYGKELLIERADAESIEVGEKITLMKWGNVNITKIDKDGDNLHVFGQVDEADQNFKGTKKFSWLIASKEHQMEVHIRELDHLIVKEKIEEADDIEKIVNNESLF